MNKTLISALGSLILATSSQTSLAAHHNKHPQPSAAHTHKKQLWDGAYVGAHLGLALGRFEVSNPFGPSIFGDTIRTPGFLGGLHAGYNWHLPESNWVYGLEASISGLDAEGSNTAFAYSGQYVSATCSMDPDFSASISGKLGISLGLNERTLLYIKGGLALLNNKLSVTNNNLFDGFVSVTKKSHVSDQWGPLIGAGIEFAMSPSCSLKLEYNYLRFADASITAPQSLRLRQGEEDYTNAIDTPSAQAAVTQHMQQILLGFNYHINPYHTDHRFVPHYWQSNETNSILNQDNWQLETGIRYFSSWGRYQEDMPNAGVSTSLVSRLTYHDLAANSGELYARLDHSSKLFIKGMIGTGRLTDGHLNDEDWGLDDEPAAYSNTISDLDNTSIHYGTVDLGYNILSGSDYRLGALIGYSFIKEQYAAINVVQTAIPDWDESLFDTPVITETGKWYALRLGLSAQAYLTPKFRVDVDCAYVPYIQYRGEDDHWLRDLVFKEMSTGRGVQFEVSANYRITPQANIGFGGRYWAIWSKNGSDAVEGETIPRLDTYRYQRFGLFLQGSYQFNG